MKRIVRLILGLAVVASIAQGEEWTKTFTVAGKADLRVETSDAHIQVDTWDQNTIKAHVTTQNLKIGEGGLRIYDHQNGDAVELEVKFPRETCMFCVHVRSQRVETTIRMPREGKVNLHTGDGKIKLSNFKGDMQLDTGDGDAEAEGVDGNLRAHTGDGHIRVGGRFDALDLKTGDGRIEAIVMLGSTVTNVWDLKTGDGSVILRLPQDFAADVDLHTNDGHITAEIPVTVEGNFGRNNLRGKINGGGRMMTIRTGDGSITLSKT
jgi:Putative adhesin